MSKPNGNIVEYPFVDSPEAIRNFDIPNPFKSKTIVDFEMCVGLDELKSTIHEINRCGYVFLTATQSGDIYTVFFWRHLT